MNDQRQLLIRSIKGPIIMITVGVLFAADRLTGYHFGETWPVLLIVIGLMQLAGGRRPRRADYYSAPPPAAAAGQPYYAPQNPPPTVPAVVPPDQNREPHA
jgi:hypothetical protein